MQGGGARRSDAEQWCMPAGRAWELLTAGWPAQWVTAVAPTSGPDTSIAGRHAAWNDARHAAPTCSRGSLPAPAAADTWQVEEGTFYSFPEGLYSEFKVYNTTADQCMAE